MLVNIAQQEWKERTSNDDVVVCGWRDLLPISVNGSEGGRDSKEGEEELKERGLGHGRRMKEES